MKAVGRDLVFAAVQIISGAALFMLLATTVRADCLPLPARDLQQLDDRADGDPEGAVREATTRLANEPGVHDPLHDAQLYAIVAGARGAQGRVDEAHAAVASARALLGRLSPAAQDQRLLDRLSLDYFMSAETRSDLEAGVRTASEIVSRAPAGSLENICALASRADLRAELMQLDLAAADGITAYALAEAAGLTQARIQSAASLATIYRRSGLLADAERMIDEVIDYERAVKLPAQLATAMYVLCQVQIRAGNFPAARATLEASRRVAIDAGDLFGAAYTDVALCPELIGAGELDAADHVCSDHVPDFVAAGRDDLVTLMLGYQARLDLGRGRPQQALARLDEVLGPRAADILPSMEPQLFHDRSRAYAALGRVSEAYVDLAHSIELQNTLDVAERSRAATVLAAKAATEKLLAERGALRRRIWIASGFALGLVCSLLAYAYWTRSRHEKYLERQRIVMRTASVGTPDTLLLLDTQGVVRFANRALPGGDATPEPGDRLESRVGESLWRSLRPALDEVFETRHPVTVSMRLPGDDGTAQHYAIHCVPVLEGSELIGATLRGVDVTELRNLEREVLDIATRERQRMSSDLHDGLGQELTAISLLLHSLTAAIDRHDPGVRPLVDEIVRYTSRTMGMTRDIAYGLSTFPRERGSLSAALRDLARKSGEKLHLEVTVRSEPAEIEVPEGVAEHLYRIAFEAVTNAARHGGCTQVGIVLQAEGGSLQMKVIDNGTGLPAGGTGSAGLGVSLMAYRARLVGGSFRLEPGEHGGAQVVVDVPLRSPLPVP